MKIRLTLHPGQNGTKKLHHNYGDRLLVVRYRYDEKHQVRFKTVELIEEQMPWDRRRDPAAVVHISVAYNEWGIRAAVKDAGGIWDKERKA